MVFPWFSHEIPWNRQGVIIQVGEDHNLPQPASAAAPPQRRRRRVSVGIGEAWRDSTGGWLKGVGAVVRRGLN